MAVQPTDERSCCFLKLTRLVLGSWWDSVALLAGFMEAVFRNG